MKSNLFGFSAKMALAALAVGTMFTSCYDSENGDVSKPYVAPAAMYTFIGTVTNDITGAPVEGAAVSLSGVIEGTATTDAQGVYRVVKEVRGGTQGEVTVAVAEADDYEAASAKVNVEKIADGQATVYFKSLVVNYTAFLPEGLDIAGSQSTSEEEGILSGEEGSENYVPGLDIMNKDSEPMLITRNFIVDKGVVVANDPSNIYNFSTKAISDEVKEAVKAYIKADLGEEPMKEFAKETVAVDILVPGLSALKNVTISYLYENKTYNCTYGAENFTVTVKRVVKVDITSAFTSFAHYHGHGHGHGHGDDINAGGGILTPEL